MIECEKKPEIILRFQRVKKTEGDEERFDQPVPVTVHFAGTDTEVFDFINPLTDKNLLELRWYLESYWQWPSDIDDDRAREVEGSLPKWGQALFDAVFQKAPDAMRLFGDFDRERQPGRRLTIDTTEPRILRLPWELLRDEGGYLFSKNPAISVLRHMHQTRRTPINAFEPPVRILMVTCRPDGAGFIDPRSIAAPLLDALEGIPEQVEVEFLRPPTLKALDARLRAEELPQVHIVHFDGHGVYDKGVGLGFLLFEDEKYQKHPVDAEQLGSLLNESGIPLMVLNACQSAQPDERNPFASVAARLIESGVGGVVAMNYSVLVETAKRFTREFYGTLAKGKSASAAMETARRGLFADTKRLTFQRPHEDELVIVHLQDWFLPALYQQADELIPFAPVAPLSPSTVSPSKGKGAGGIGAGLRGSFPPAPLHGFKGRARELLDLERAFATRNIVVLHGFGGQGKTSLAAQAAEWFTRAHLFERAAFVTFETGASFDFVLNELGTALVRDDFANEQNNKKVAAIATALQEKTALLVFDNFESALPGGNAPMGELQELLNAAAKWVTADEGPRTNDQRSSSSVFRRSSLLITTRNADIPHAVFTPGKNCLHKELEGLAQSDALELAASILEAHSLPRPPRVPLENLLAFLKGHPLSLQLALPQLRTYSAGQLVEQYQAILPQMQTGAARERNESLAVSLRFSLNRLGPEAQTLLARLAVFESGAWEPNLLQVTEIPENDWNALKPQLTSTALVRLEEIPGVSVPFVHFHPTLVPYLRAVTSNQEPETSASAPESIENRYWQEYYQFANFLYETDTQHPLQARALATRELPNLKRALKLALEAGALDEAVDFADSINRFLDHFGRWRERDEVAELVEREIGKLGDQSTNLPITRSQYLTESGRGERLLQQGRAGQAEQIFRALLQRLEGAAAYDTRYDQTITLRNIGLSLGAQGRPAPAADCYRRALGLAQGLEQTENVKKQIGAYHTDLADVFAALGQYDNARKEYELALVIDRELDDTCGEGADISQLGTLALRQGNLDEARKRYLEALGLFQRMGEDQSEAVIWHQLGMVAETQRDWDEAERCYKESVAIEEQLGHAEGVAQTCNQLAIVAKNAGRPQEAERWYLRAIELNEKLGNRQLLAGNYNNLADLYLAQNRLEQAETLARRALAIKATLDLSSEPWKTCQILAEIAEKCGRLDEARAWRRQAQESFAAFAGSDTQIKQFEPLIAAVVQAANGDEKAKAYLEGEYPKMQGAEEWRTGAQAFKRLVAGERDFESLTDGLVRTQALIIRRALEALNGEAAPSPRPAPESGRAGEAEQEPEISFEEFLGQLLGAVEMAAQGNSLVGKQVAPVVEKLAKDPSMPAEMRAFGRALRDILYGNKAPNLDGVPNELASAIRGLLGRLKH